MKTVALIEGYAGGYLLSKHFRKALQGAGYKVVKDTSNADYIIAHSAGCYLVPADNRAQKIILIGPPYWPGRGLLKRAFGKLKAEHPDLKNRFGRKYIIKKKMLETYYVFRRPRATLALKGNPRSLDFLDKHNKSKLILVRNLDDKFCWPNLSSSIDTSIIKLIELPGQHDDYYTNHDPYINLLKVS